MKIAITSFVDNSTRFADEANLMTYSGRNLDSRFLFVLFVHPDMCNKIIKRHNVLVYSYETPDKDFYQTYKYAKSLEFVKSNEQILLDYDQIIKTDTDVFFTESINSRVFNDFVYVGPGKYLFNQESVSEVSDLAKKYGYSYVRKSDMHSTLIGPAKVVVDIMQLSDALCKDIFYELCPSGDYESQIAGKWGSGAYSGTSSMIATEIVASSLFYDKTIIDHRIDGDCFSATQNVSEVDHIHQWHGDGVFSKFDAANGVYANSEVPTGNSISEYCLRTYLESVRNQ